MDILIIDSGGTKSDLVRLNEGEINYLQSAGFHPAYASESELADELKKTVDFTPDKIYFYGAGCHGEESRSKIRRSVKQLFPECDVEVSDDLTGAARAHLKSSDGLIVSLGTGSICGRYQNGQIVARSASLGYAIGDEGSAVDLGRIALKSYFRKELDTETEQEISKRLGESHYSAWMQRIYESDKPNRQLASVAGLVFQDPLTGQLRQMVKRVFQNFLESQFVTLSPLADEPVVCTGTVACSHESILKSVMNENGFSRVTIRKSIIRGLADYHAP